MKAKALLVLLAFALASTLAMAQEPDEITTPDLTSTNPHSAAQAPRGHRNGQGHARFGIPDIDSLVNWNSHFKADGVDGSGHNQIIWYTNAVGNPPQLGGTTTINAPIVPVSLDLRNFDGSPRFVNGHPLVYDVTPFVALAAGSPVFQNANFSSSDVPTQVTDAVQRAEYFNQMKPDWHTMLAPSVKATRTMVLIRGTYAFALNGDGTCCRFVLVDVNAFFNALFPPTFPVDNSTVIGSAEVAGDITTKDISTFLFPNTFLFIGNTSNCCILGFHTYDFEPGDASNGDRERRYVVNYSSWITPGLFGPAFLDDTAISHEVAETFNDPFVASDNIHNIVPWWLSPNGNCQNNLEDGDVVEGLPNAVFPVLMPNGHTYHPQNEALLQFFTSESPSSAFQGAYSYPNTSTLTGPTTKQNVGCQ